MIYEIICAYALLQILVHGEANEMHRLKVALQDKYADQEDAMRIYTPRNCEALELYFRGEKMAKVGIIEFL